MHGRQGGTNVNRRSTLLACFLVVALFPSRAVAQRDLQVSLDDPTKTYAGAPDQTLAAPIRIRLTRAGAVAIDSETCVSVSVQFTVLSAGSVAPSLAAPAWTGRCVADARWRLSTEVGRQFLQVTLLQPASPTPNLRSNPLVIEAQAALPARDLRIAWVGRFRTGLVNRTTTGVVARITFTKDTTAPDSAQCNTLAIQVRSFGRGSGGTTSPSPAQAYWRRGEGNGGDACLAEVSWRLGDEPGDQYLDAVVQQGSAQAPVIRSNAHDAVLKTAARQLPDIVFGISGIIGARDLSDTLSVIKAAYSGAPGRFVAQPILGAEFPLLLGSAFPWDRLRAIAGFSFKNPGRELYLGFSVFPILLYGPKVESYPIHLAAGVRFQRVTVLDAGVGCTPGVTTQVSCRVDHWNARLFISALTSGTSFLSNLLKGFGV